MPGVMNHAVVHVVEPGEGRELAVDLGQVIAVLAQRPVGEDHASLRPHALGVAGEPVAVDDLVAAPEQPVVRRLELRIGVFGEQQPRATPRPMPAG